MVEYFNTNPIPPHPRKNITQTRQALRVYSRAFKVNIRNICDPMIQLQETQSEVKRFLGDSFEEMGGFKFSEALEIEFSRQTAEGKNEHQRKYCDSKQHIVIDRSSIQESLQLAREEILKKASNIMPECSNWVIVQVHRDYINVAKYNPLEGGSWIDLPPEFKNSKYGQGKYEKYGQ